MRTIPHPRFEQSRKRRTNVYLFFAVVLLLLMSCLNENKRRWNDRTSQLAKKTSASATTSKNEKTSLETDAARVDIVAGAFSKPADVTLSDADVSSFLKDAGLPTSASIDAGPVALTSVLTGTDQKVDPVLALKIDLFMPNDQDFHDDAVMVIIVTKADGTKKIFFVAHDELKYVTDPSSGKKYVEVEALVAGNFVMALVSGVSEKTLKETYVQLPTNGNITDDVDEEETAAVPAHAATSLSFTDTDANGSEIAGNLTINAASDESDITHYVLYWGTNATTKQSSTPIATLAVTGGALTHAFSANTAIPSSPAASHLLVFTKNSSGEMATGVSLLIIDLGVPTHAAVNVSFTDTDTDGGELAGNISITKATDESDVTDYVLYWGTSATTKQSGTPITTLSATGINLTHNLAANTAIPTSPTATHILVYTSNAEGEMATGVSVTIIDAGVPVHAAVAINFTDTDTDGGQLGGDVTITRAADETDITNYVLYWGSSSTVKQNVTPIATLPVSGNVTHTFAANTSIPGGPAATHLLVFTENADGEMATGVSLLIADIGVPTNAAALVSFTDGDTTAGEISGTVDITKSIDESDITHYVLYWGSNSTTKQSGTPIATIDVTGGNVSHNFAANTTIPTSPTATHLLVFTKNGSGEMATGVNVAISDNNGSGCGSGGAVVATVCWYIGATGESCNTVCTGLGKTFNQIMSDGYAGAAGSLAHCKEVVDAIFGGNNAVADDRAAACGAAVGCGDSQSATSGYTRCTASTTDGTASLPNFKRICACN